MCPLYFYSPFPWSGFSDFYPARRGAPSEQNDPPRSPRSYSHSRPQSAPHEPGTQLAGSAAHLVCIVEAVVHEPCDQRRLPDCKTTRERASAQARAKTPLSSVWEGNGHHPPSKEPRDGQDTGAEPPARWLSGAPHLVPGCSAQHRGFNSTWRNHFPSENGRFTHIHPHVCKEPAQGCDALN